MMDHALHKTLCTYLGSLSCRKSEAVEKKYVLMNTDVCAFVCVCARVCLCVFCVSVLVWFVLRSVKKERG